MSADLAAALAAEEAAIYAYGLIGVRFTAAGERADARAAEQEHRQRRDYLVSLMNQLKASAAPAPAGYRMPFPVADRAGALKLAIRVEDGVAQAWRATLPATDPAGRSEALANLTDSAVRATRWRRQAAVTPITLAFPGRPS
jgi:hypothetical protein